jgi:hypothetical protein
MARIRTVKPEFFTSEDIVCLSPLARLLYIALWCEADKEGRFVWKPLTFKLRYFPADDCNINQLCQEILDRGLVSLYGDGLAFIPAFTEHQHINPRETPSRLPTPDASSTREPRVINASQRDSDAQGGREGKDIREHASSTRKKKTLLPPNFGISDRVMNWAAEKGHSNLEMHLESFTSKCRSKGYEYVDWDEAFMEAIRKNWAGVQQAQPQMEFVSK